MPAVSGFQSAATIIKAAAALVALFPGIAMLLGLVDIPPSLADLVKIISFSISIIVLLAVFLLAERIRGISNGWIAALCLVAVVAGAASVAFYYQFANRYTVVVEGEEVGADGQREKQTYIIPLRPTQTIRDIVEPMNNDYQVALQISPEREDLKRELIAASGSSMTVMILLLVLSQVLLIAPVVTAAWKLAGAPDIGTEGAKD